MAHKNNLQLKYAIKYFGNRKSIKCNDKQYHKHTHAHIYIYENSWIAVAAINGNMQMLNNKCCFAF